MKKILAVVLCMVTILAVSGIAFARHHQPAQQMTISEIRDNARDDQRVIVDGQIIDRVYKDIYTFKDTNGDTIKIEIDDDDWYAVEMNKPVRIYAEVDKNWHSSDVELEVKRIQDL